jgi:hypothetical protein
MTTRARTRKCASTPTRRLQVCRVRAKRFSEYRRVWRVRTKWFDECRQVWQVRAKRSGKSHDKVCHFIHKKHILYV